MMKIHTLPMGPVQANCYVVIDEHSGEAAVIDPGDYTDELKSVLRDEVKISSIFFSPTVTMTTFSALRI